MLALVALLVAFVILVFFGIGYGLGRLLLACGVAPSRLPLMTRLWTPLRLERHLYTDMGLRPT